MYHDSLIFRGVSILRFCQILLKEQIYIVIFMVELQLCLASVEISGEKMFAAVLLPANLVNF